MKTFKHSLQDREALKTVAYPMNPSIFPDCLNWDACVLDSMEWVREDNGELKSITINFHNYSEAFQEGNEDTIIAESWVSRKLGFTHWRTIKERIAANS